MQRNEDGGSLMEAVEDLCETDRPHVLSGSKERRRTDITVRQNNGGNTAVANNGGNVMWSVVSKGCGDRQTDRQTRYTLEKGGCNIIISTFNIRS
jgi:hypothetical protein